MNTNNNTTSLKRHQFAEQIRQQKRQRMKQQIRNTVAMQHEMLHQGMTLNIGIFKQIKQECYAKQFNEIVVFNALQYLCKQIQLSDFAQQNVLKFFIEINKNLFGFNKQRREWKDQATQMMSKSIKKIIDFEVSKQRNQNNSGQEYFSRQLGQLSLLRNCFSPIFQLACNYQQYFQLWQQISLVDNQQFIHYAFNQFSQILKRIIGSLSQDQMTTVVTCIHNFIDSVALQPDKKIRSIDILNEIFNNYILGTEDLKISLDAIMNWLNCKKYQNLDDKVTLLANQTTLIQEIVIYLDRTNQKYKHTNPDSVSKISKFIARIFCASDEVCHKAYYNCMAVIQYLRSWLPAQAGITKAMLEQSHRGVTTHNNQICTQSVLFALSNIVGTDNNFVGIFLQTDIYRTFLYLYKLVPVKCREEIAVCIYNMIYKSTKMTLNIMLDLKLPDLISQMLGQKNQEILWRTLQMTIFMMEDLEDDMRNNENIHAQWQITLPEFLVTIEKLGITSQCQKLISHQNQKIGDLAFNLLEAFDKNRPK